MKSVKFYRWNRTVPDFPEYPNLWYERFCFEDDKDWLDMVHYFVEKGLYVGIHEDVKYSLITIAINDTSWFRQKG